MRSWALSANSMVKNGLLSMDEAVEISKDIKQLDCTYQEGVKLVTDVIEAAKPTNTNGE